MPHLDSEMADFRGHNCFASLDFCQGYWQLPLHPDSYDACGIIAPHRTFSSKRTLPGLTNCTAYFQSSVEPLFSELRSNMKAWLDDFNLFAKTENHLLQLLERFFAICKEKRLFLSAKKCEFFSSQIKWCGRIFSAKGYTMDPTNSESLRNMSEPKTADELCQFVHCCRWMSVVIPNFVQRVAPLVELLEAAYKKSGRRTKRSIKSIKLSSLSWGAVHSNAFRSLQDSLRKAVEIAHPDPKKVICIFTDASKYFWSGVVTQVRKEQMGLSREKQEHEPLAFLGSAFSGAELNWSTFEQEAYAIFQTFEKLDYLLLDEQEVHVFTDHRNLLFIFAPLAFEPGLGRHITSKVQRWAMYLSRFTYVIEHVAGDANIFADMHTRWTRGYRSEKLMSKNIYQVSSSKGGQIIPSAEEVEWLLPDEVRELQKGDYPPSEGIKGADGIVTLRNRIWIPEGNADTKRKLMVLAHCGISGHRGVLATQSVIKEQFFWKGLENDVRSFINGCIHCLVSRSGETIPRPLGSQLHGKSPNEVLHMDFLYMGNSSNDEKYVLIFREDFSSFVWLFPYASATSEAAAEALATWIATFGCPIWVVTDQGAHFKNRLLKDLTREMKVQHHFTTAYSPWANGTVERVCKEVLRATRALLSELRLPPTSWPAVLEMVQSILNQSPWKRLGSRENSPRGIYRTPLEVFTSCRPRRPLLKALPIGDYSNTMSLDEARARQLCGIEELQGAMELMHKDVKGLISSSRKSAIERHNSKTNVREFSFHVGDFVLVRTQEKRLHKLQFIWRGPRRITKALSDWTYEVENLDTGKKNTVHARRMILYRAALDGRKVEDALLSYAKHNEGIYYEIDSLKDIREGENGFEFLVNWKGLPDEIDYTWEPLHQLLEDVPEILIRFLKSGPVTDLKRKAIRLCP